MWFGTYDGLNKYDGYSFKKYNHRIGDSASLADNMVLAIAEDDAGRHWIAAGSGVSVLNDNTSAFTRVKYRKSANTGISRLESMARSIANDGQGNMLVGTDEGLIIFDKGDLTGRKIQLSLHGKLIDNYSVKSILLGNDRHAWLSVPHIGICMYNSLTGMLEVQYPDAALNANCIAQGIGDTLLVGTDDALYIYSIRNNKLLPFSGPDGQPFRPGRIMHLYVDQAKKIWIGTDGNGVRVVNANTHATVTLPELIGGQTITSNAIYDIYEDDQQRKWIGTFRGGINMIDNGGYDFYSIRQDLGTKNSLVSDFVFSFCQDANGDIWIGTDGGGISVWNRQKNTFHNYTIADKTGLTSNNITNMVADNQNNIWIASYGGGVVKHDWHRRIFQRVPVEGEKEGQYAWQLYKDPMGIIWLGAGNENKALYRYDTRIDRFVSLPLLTGSVTALTGDRYGHLWVGGNDTVKCINPNGRVLLSYPTHAPVRSILEATDGVIWIGTQGNGLLQYDRGQVRRHDERQGLSNNNVMSIREDKTGSLWISTFNGLSRFFPAQQRFENYYDVDGLQSNQFYYNASLKLRSGEMLFGGIKGFTLFSPEACVPKKTFPPLVVTGIRILNEEVKGNNPYISGNALSAPLKIELPYSKAVLSVDFAALEYSLPRKIQYTCLLQGWDKTWSLPGHLKTVNYSELREGDYLLRIRSTNTSGIWNSSELQLPIRILPPWYRTWWFRLSIILAVVAMIGALLFYWEKQRRIQYQIKLSELKHQQEMELNERRLSFFTNISHEFRSPLTLIINPIREILKKGALPEDSLNLKVLYSNSQRLLKMTDQLLMFRKADSEWGSLVMAPLDLLNLCRQVYFSFSNEAKLKSLDYVLDCSLAKAMVVADQEKMEIVLFNLISNAIKFSPQKGKVRVHLEEQAGSFTVSVHDQGPGIPADIGARLFQKFYQAPNTQTDKQATTKGFGIGLFLAKSFTDLHNGKLSYHCPASGGTVFVLSLLEAVQQNTAAPVELITVTAEQGSTNPESAALPFVQHSITEAAMTEGIPGMPDERLGELVSAKKVMLVIDNDKQLTAYVKHLFNTLVVYEAASVTEGWQKVQEIGPDIIICDLLLDGSNGMDFCSKLKTSTSHGHIPVILLTGVSSGDVKQAGMECGADDYIIKPFDSDLLKARVHNILKDRDVLKRYFFNEITLQSNSLRVSDEFQGFLADCIAIVEEHVDRDDFDSKVFAKKMGMSRSKLYTRVKSIAGLSVNEFIKLIRLRKAAELMIHSDGQVKEIAFRVGFSDPKYFREQFFQLFQLNPSDYIKKYRKTFQNNTHLSDQVNQAKNK